MCAVLRIVNVNSLDHLTMCFTFILFLCSTSEKTLHRSGGRISTLHFHGNLNEKGCCYQVASKARFEFPVDPV